MFRRRLLLPTGIVAVLLLGGGLVYYDWYDAIPASVEAKYIGRQSCASCHKEQVAAWTNSQHDMAMDIATSKTVLGNFDNQTLKHHGITSTMFRKGDDYYIRTEGPDGKLQEFKIKYTFGVHPMQQYMVEFVGNEKKFAETNKELNGHPRIQVLPITWDVEKKRWFHLTPDEKPAAGSAMHWTGRSATWNHMCAECHSTRVRKNYKYSEQQFHTTFSEIDVSCEACHGPASTHVEAAEKKWFFWDRNHGYGLRNKIKNTGTTQNRDRVSAQAELDTCAGCHSRKSVIYPGFEAGDKYLNHNRLALLHEGLYHPDGQILSEVYVYGSFLQSRMYREHVRCTDCHDPHTAKLKRPGNRLCTECHEPAKYDRSAHHRHTTGSSGASCVECHMPHKTYMQIDPRRDHSLRVPRPDLSLKIGTPNACVGCHLEVKKRTQSDSYAKLLKAVTDGDEKAAKKLQKQNQWATDQVRSWFGTEREKTPHYGETFHLARRGDPAALENLIKIAADRKNYGPIVRATAVSLLPTYLMNEQRISFLGADISNPGLDAMMKALKDPDPQVRLAAVEGFPTLTPGKKKWIDHASLHVAPMLKDPIRSVRDSAVRSLITVRISERETNRVHGWHPMFTKNSDKEIVTAFDRALKEYRKLAYYHGDQAGGRTQLALLYEYEASIADSEEGYKRSLRNAITEYRRAIHLEPEVAGSRANLAALLDRQGKTEEAEKLRKEMAQLLKRDVGLQPRHAGIRYQYALALYGLKRLDEAEVEFKKASELAPFSDQYLLMLTLLYQKREKWSLAVEAAERLLKMYPNSGMYQNVLKDMQHKVPG